MHVTRLFTPLLVIAGLPALMSCDRPEPAGSEKHNRITFETLATVRDRSLTEISGIEVLDDSGFVVHNDDGKPRLYMLDRSGGLVARVNIKGARNRDWEDITQFEHEGRSILAVGDIGDNLGRRSSLQIFFIQSPRPESTKVKLLHTLELVYPDGARDCESLAYDPSARQLLFLTKRDKPPRLYAADIDAALSKPSLELSFQGTVPAFRPPARRDTWRLGGEARRVSRPTGMDISADGTLAAVITYRSLYLFERNASQSWIEAFQNPPREFSGPASNHEEAIAFDFDDDALVISSEGHPAPIYRVKRPPPADPR